MITFGERLRELRKERKVKQEELGNFIGVSERTIRNYEMGKREPTIGKLIELADFFDVTLDSLVGRYENSEQKSSFKRQDNDHPITL